MCPRPCTAWVSPSNDRSAAPHRTSEGHRGRVTERWLRQDRRFLEPGNGTRPTSPRSCRRGRPRCPIRRSHTRAFADRRAHARPTRTNEPHRCHHVKLHLTPSPHRLFVLAGANDPVDADSISDEHVTRVLPLLAENFDLSSSIRRLGSTSARSHRWMRHRYSVGVEPGRHEHSQPAQSGRHSRPPRHHGRSAIAAQSGRLQGRTRPVRR